MVPSGELHITAVDYKHTHHPYFCIVKHRNTGASQESLPFHLTVRDSMSYSKPEQMTDQEFYISVEQGNTAALPCRVQGTPPPTLSWFHVNSNLLQPVSYGTRIHSLAHMLLVEGAQASDGGQYRCTARNEMGELSVTLHLQVEPPLVVGNETVQNKFVCLSPRAPITRPDSAQQSLRLGFKMFLSNNS